MSWCKRNTYLTVEAIEDGVNVNIYRNFSDEDGIAKDDTTGNDSFQIQLNDGDWTDVSWKTDIEKNKYFNLINAVTDKSSMNAGDKLKFRNISKWKISQYASDFTNLVITNAKAKVYGKLAKSLTSEFATHVPTDMFDLIYKLGHFFEGSTGLIDASELSLDDIALAGECYFGMFRGCTSLVNAPALPATTLTDGCYNSMFYGCTSLTVAPQLPATTLARYCYAQMFQGCTSLVNAPELPATTFASGCYFGMFVGCAKINELHFPMSVESQIRAMSDGPTFCATNATAKFDL